MDKIIWKSFKLGDLFELSTEHVIKKQLKELIISDTKKENYIGIVTSSQYNNGITGYVEDTSDFDDYRKKDILTIASNGSIGSCFYQKENIISTGDNKYLKINNKQLKNILDLNKKCYLFIAKILMKIFKKSNIFSFGYKLNKFNFSRELILLPCIEVQSTDEYIWEENNKYWTLATEYITELLEKANNKKSENKNNYYQIKLKEANANKIKYESEFNEFLKSYEKKSIIWKSFKLGDLFELSTEHCIKKPLKELNVSNTKQENYIGIVNASKYNNGIVGYVEDSSDFDDYRKNNILTIACNGSSNGCCFYQKENIISTGDNKYLKINNKELKNALDLNKNYYLFIAKILTQIFRKSNLFDFAYKLNNFNFSRELILLPCIEVQSTDEYIWEENNKYWTLATEYIKYLDLKSKIKKEENKIKDYRNNL